MISVRTASVDMALQEDCTDTSFADSFLEPVVDRLDALHTAFNDII